MRICVYCSSSSAVDRVYTQAARELGQLVGARGHALVYGGANVGLMHELARAAKGAGAHVLGVIPRRLQQLGLAEELADEIIVTETLAERKAQMEAQAEAFIALPGGLGTLDELLQVLTLKQLGYLHKAVVLLNTAGFWEHLLAHLERLYRQRFAKEAFRQLYFVASSPREAIAYVEGYKATETPSKWFGPSRASPLLI